MAKRGSAGDALAILGSKLRAAGTAARAKSEKAYLKSDLVFYGTAMPDLRSIAVEYAKAHPDLDRRALKAIARAAWKTDVFELRSVSVALLDRRKALLEDRDLPWLLDLVDGSATWAHVDWIAATIIGDVVGRYPASLRWLPVWAKQKNFWIRRTALLAQLNTLKHGEGDWDLFTDLAAGMLDEKEFFIRKAIGWVLREVSKKRPKLVLRVHALAPRRDERAHAARGREVPCQTHSAKRFGSSRGAIGRGSPTGSGARSGGAWSSSRSCPSARRRRRSHPWPRSVTGC
jgi:3-methyladenine DNA glycosylase AlkD